MDVAATEIENTAAQRAGDNESARENLSVPNTFGEGGGPVQQRIIITPDGGPEHDREFQIVPTHPLPGTWMPGTQWTRNFIIAANDNTAELSGGCSTSMTPPGDQGDDGSGFAPRGVCGHDAGPAAASFNPEQRLNEAGAGHVEAMFFQPAQSAGLRKR